MNHTKSMYSKAIKRPTQFKIWPETNTRSVHLVYEACAGIVPYSIGHMNYGGATKIETPSCRYFLFLYLLVINLSLTFFISETAKQY